LALVGMIDGWTISLIAVCTEESFFVVSAAVVTCCPCRGSKGRVLSKKKAWDATLLATWVELRIVC
jgi:hypothetical protein